MLLEKENRSMVPSAFDDISFDLCKRRDDVLMMSADLAHYVDLYKVTKELPDQYVEVGMAEQNLVGVAAGLAKAGFTPVTTTFGSYASRRCFDQMVICMGTSVNGGVKLGHGAAQNWATLGLCGTRVMGGGQSSALSI
jgi:transketolase